MGEAASGGGGSGRSGHRGNGSRSELTVDAILVAFRRRPDATIMIGLPSGVPMTSPPRRLRRRRRRVLPRRFPVAGHRREGLHPRRRSAHWCSIGPTGPPRRSSTRCTSPASCSSPCDPALAEGSLGSAVLHGALFGFFCYATYDLTNLATLKGWTLPMALVDIGWGTVVTAIAAAAGYPRRAGRELHRPR